MMILSILAIVVSLASLCITLKLMVDAYISQQAVLMLTEELNKLNKKIKENKSDVVYSFKGTLDYRTDLDNILFPKTGDVYLVRYKGSSGSDPIATEYMYDGFNWIEIGSVVDMCTNYDKNENKEVP